MEGGSGQRGLMRSQHNDSRPRDTRTHTYAHTRECTRARTSAGRRPHVSKLSPQKGSGAFCDSGRIKLHASRPGHLCVYVCVRACVRAHARVCVFVCVLAWVCAWVYLCVRARARVCVGVCAGVCVFVGVCVSVSVYVLTVHPLPSFLVVVQPHLPVRTGAGATGKASRPSCRRSRGKTPKRKGEGEGEGEREGEREREREGESEKE